MQDAGGQKRFQTPPAATPNRSVEALRSLPRVLDRYLQVPADPDRLVVLVRHAVAAPHRAALHERAALVVLIGAPAENQEHVAGCAAGSPEPVVVVAADRGR